MNGMRACAPRVLVDVQMLSKLQDEVRANRFMCEEKLARELDDKESQLIECDGMLRAEPMSDEQIFELQQV